MEHSPKEIIVAQIVKKLTQFM